MINFSEIKEKFELFSVVCQHLGEPARTFGNDAFWHSPFNPKDREPSFCVTISKNMWYDFSTDQGGDVLNFIGLHVFGNIKNVLEAAKYLENEPEIAVKKPKVTAKPKPPTSVNIELVKKWALHLDDAISYFKTRGIKESSVKKNLMGADTCFYFRREYKVNGEVYELPSVRYSIPYWSGNTIKCVNRRRDDEKALALIQSCGEEFVASVRQEIGEKGDIVSHLFGPKYLKMGTFPIYNINTLYETDHSGNLVIKDNLPVPKVLPYVFITEGEIDAQSVHDAGYYAVAAKKASGVNINYPLSKVKMPIIIADNDEAGMIYAQNIAKQIQNPLCRIVLPSNGHKDANDMIVAGVFENWASLYGILPNS